MTSYERLAHEIILLAVKDYKAILTRLAKKANDRNLIIKKDEVEIFFRSEWFGVLSGLDGEEIMKRIYGEISGQKVGI